MLDILRTGFEGAKAALTGKATLTEANVDEAVQRVRRSLLEADVHLDVVHRFVGEVKARAIGEVVQTRAAALRASPGEHFTRICYDELVKLMGPTQSAPLVYRRPATMIMLLGLQGVGKTTTCGKLAKYLLAQKRRPLLVAADLQRPAAQAQLRTLAERVGVPCFAPTNLTPPELAAQARAQAKQQRCDVILLDTAGRLSIDGALMDELAAMREASRPDETLLVVDAMAGQDSLATAQRFVQRVPLTGFIMTKLDGDARGGAALSLKHVLQVPIKFLGTGEALDKLEPFRAEGLASRILGMGDIVGLMQDFSSVVDEKKAEVDARRMLRGSFTLDDFLTQLQTLEKMGSVRDLVAKMPLFGSMKRTDMAKVDDKTFVGLRSLIQSMTKAERAQPGLLTPARRRRVALGAGRTVAEVDSLMQRFEQMQAMLQMFGKGGGLGGLMGKGGGARGGMPRDLQSLAARLGQSGGMPAGAPGLPGPSGVAGPPAGSEPGVAEGLDLQALQQMAGGGSALGRPRPASSPVSQKDQQKRKNERKSARKARKRGRR